MSAFQIANGSGATPAPRPRSSTARAPRPPRPAGHAVTMLERKSRDVSAMRSWTRTGAASCSNASDGYPRSRWWRTASARLAAHLPVHPAGLPRQRICRGKGHHGNVDRGRDRAQEPRSGRLPLTRGDGSSSGSSRGSGANRRLAKDFEATNRLRTRLPLRRIRHAARASDRSCFVTFETDFSESRAVFAAQPSQSAAAPSAASISWR